MVKSFKDLLGVRITLAYIMEYHPCNFWSKEKIKSTFFGRRKYTTLRRIAKDWPEGVHSPMGIYGASEYTDFVWLCTKMTITEICNLIDDNHWCSACPVTKHCIFANAISMDYIQNKDPITKLKNLVRWMEKH